MTTQRAAVTIAAILAVAAVLIVAALVEPGLAVVLAFLALLGVFSL